MAILTPSDSLVNALQRLRTSHPPLHTSALIIAALGLFFFAGLFLDARYLTGAPLWLKPLKFSVSISIYSLGILWILGFLQGRKRLISVLAWIITLSFATEMLAIASQAARGVRSHFNVTTPYDSSVFIVMGVAISLLWLAHFALTVLVLRQKLSDPALRWALRLGMVISLVGLSVGFLMTNAAVQKLVGGNIPPISLSGAHAVGVVDGGPGLPVVGWSTQGGDLRAGHFIGMHALQVLPLLAWMLNRRRMHDRRRLGLILTAAFAYLGVTVLVTWQALRGQSLVAPDDITLSAAGLLLLMTSLAAALVLRFSPRTAATT